MLYQLPNGKVVTLTLDQYLDLTDEDIQYLMSMNAGDYVRNPFHGSATKPKRKRKPQEEDPEDIDTGIDFTSEDEDGPREPRRSPNDALDDFPGEVPDAGAEPD